MVCAVASDSAKQKECDGFAETEPLTFDAVPQIIGVLAQGLQTTL